MEDISVWRSKIEAASSVDVSHKALKVRRALWRVIRALRYAAPLLGAVVQGVVSADIPLHELAIFRFRRTKR